ncbi:MAG: hypothetical protein ACPGVG_07650 [Mycobacterium sp.]
MGIATVLAVMARLLLMFGENRRLLTEVSDQALRDPLTVCRTGPCSPTG